MYKKTRFFAADFTNSSFFHDFRLKIYENFFNLFAKCKKRCIFAAEKEKMNMHGYLLVNILVILDLQ